MSTTRPLYPTPFISAAALALLLSACASAPVHEVVLLVGQSNMSGRGNGVDPLADVQPDARLLMWNSATARIEGAHDPLPHQDLGKKPVAVGPGISFGQAWLAHKGVNARVVLVPAAYGGTGFSDKSGSWRVTGPAVSPLTIEAVARANAAVAALRSAGAQVRLQAILWHQGETDGGNGMDASVYRSELIAMAGYLRSHVDGASASTPFVVGQYVPAQIAGSASLAAITEVNRTLPGVLAHSGCAGSRGLTGNPSPDGIHFDAASQRVMGERYAAALDAVVRGTKAPECDW